VTRILNHRGWLIGLLCSIQQLSAAPRVGSCAVFPDDHIWNTAVDNMPVNLLSGRYVETIGANKPLHPDFGAGRYRGVVAGIPFLIVPRGQTRVPILFRSPESDPGPFPIPPDAPIEGEGGPPGAGDRHVLVVEQGECKLYELFAAEKQADGSWKAGSTAVFDLNGYALRPAGWTSADAAGLPLLPGLVRYEEVAAGEIRHAIRFTAPRTRRAYVWPARHYASRLTDPQYPPMGQRFRLRQDYPVNTFPTQARVILRALQKYGMMLSDNGGAWFISGAPNDRWDNGQLRTLRRVHGSDFQAVDVSSLQNEPNSARTRKSRPDERGPRPPAPGLRQ